MRHTLSIITWMVAITLSAQVDSLSGGATYFLKKGNPDGKMAKPGELFRFHASMYSQSDSLMFSTEERGEPPLVKFDTAKAAASPIEEVLELMHVGDLVRVNVPMDFYPQKPPGLEGDSVVFYDVTLLEIITEEEYKIIKETEAAAALAERNYFQSRAPEVMEFHKKTIAEYQSAMLENLQTTESGLKYLIHEQGEGPLPEKGERVAVAYVGSLAVGALAPFDESFNRGEPIQFTVGAGQVIPGWDEGLMLLPRGSKATFFIPADLAYGDRGAGSAIPGGAELVFYVELLEKK